MSFTNNEKEHARPFALCVGGRADGEIIYLNPEADHKSIRRKPWRVIHYDEGHFEMLPDPEHIRVLYIAAPAGAGKSTWCAQFISKHKKMYPKSKFILFSRVNQDAPLDALKPKREIIDEALVEVPMEIEELPDNSIILFDDIDTISDDKIRHAVYKIKDQILEIGRHKKITILVTSHLINGNDKKTTRTILNEAQAVTIFPSSGSTYGIKYFAKNYVGLSSTQIQLLLDLESRWVTIIKTAPNCIISEHMCCFVKELGKRETD